MTNLSDLLPKQNMGHMQPIKNRSRSRSNDLNMINLIKLDSRKKNHDDPKPSKQLDQAILENLQKGAAQCLTPKEQKFSPDSNTPSILNTNYRSRNSLNQSHNNP